MNLIKQCDLIVAGGGFSGAAAAIAAARRGMNVLLIEKGNCFGGAAVNCLVNPFMYYWTQDPVSGETVFLANGIFREILTELTAMNAMPQNSSIFHEEYLKLILQRMVLKENIHILFHTWLTGVRMDNGRVRSVLVSNKEGTGEYAARYFIDCTGDGDLASWPDIPITWDGKKTGSASP